MDHYFKPVRPEDAKNGVIRNSRAHYESRRSRPTGQGNSAGQEVERKSSHLADVKARLLQALERVEEIDDLELAEEIVWPFVRSELVESYYNGVRDGASGRVKPKESA